MPATLSCGGEWAFMRVRAPDVRCVCAPWHRSVCAELSSNALSMCTRMCVCACVRLRARDEDGGCTRTRTHGDCMQAGRHACKRARLHTRWLAALCLQDAMQGGQACSGVAVVPAAELGFMHACRPTERQAISAPIVRACALPYAACARGGSGAWRGPARVRHADGAG